MTCGLKLDDLDTDEVTVPPEEVKAEKQTLLTKLHSFEKKEEIKVLETPKQEPKIEIPVVIIPKKTEVSEEEIKARQTYLKQQRDKLLALKKQVREKQLGAETELLSGGGEGSAKVQRPKSARMAHAALSGSALAPSPDAMQLRRALATKLKTEVVEGTN